MEGIREGGKYDVIVAGGGPGGLPAAISAARMGLKVLLLERSAILGGMAVSSLPLLGYIDRTGRRVLGGIAHEMVMRLQEKGASRGHIADSTDGSLTIVNPNWLRILAFEMCEEAGVETRLYANLIGVHVDNGCVSGVTVSELGKKVHYETHLLIDGTGNGCAAAMAGANFERNEKLQPGSLVFTLGNVDIDRLLRYLETHPGDRRLPDTYGVHQEMEQFFNRRGFSVTGLLDTIEKARKVGDFTIPRDCAVMVSTNEKDEIHINTGRVIDVDPTDAQSLSRAEFEAHRQVDNLIGFFQKYVPGFENCFLAYLAPCFGVRECRRVIGIKSLTGESVQKCLIPQDSIALAGYNFDVHLPGSEKTSIQPVEHAVGIPYGCLVSENIDGLMMSGRCISATNDAYGLSRIIGTCMAIGEAAGTAAVLCHRQNIQPRQVDTNQLRALLTENKAIVS